AVIGFMKLLPKLRFIWIGKVRIKGIGYEDQPHFDGMAEHNGTTSPTGTTKAWRLSQKWRLCSAKRHISLPMPYLV
ncbi:hypothetical protein, partial [Bacteroides hominis]|uniref:hypothetical protein n=1 Tax=Bacteroides hominis TaxID=2763023 RepID=UPI003D6CF22F